MKDLHRRFDTALNDTVKEWKSHKEVKGIFAYGSFVRGTVTANSDLDIGIVWGADDAPVRCSQCRGDEAERQDGAQLLDLAFNTSGASVHGPAIFLAPEARNSRPTITQEISIELPP